MAPKISRPRACGKEDEPPPVKMYKFVGNKLGYRSRQLLYQAVLDAKTAGKAPHWQFVDVVQNEEKDTVVLRCTFCQREYSSRNPSESVGKHFTVVDGLQTCVVMTKQQECVNANRTAAAQGTASV
jgi:hypothetical protein